MEGSSQRRSLRVLIADDEPLGGKRILRLLEREPDVEVLGIAEDGTEAVEMIRDFEPDLVFLDVEMPRRTGIEVVESIGPARMPPTIFITAYDQYALRAFDLAAVDYLVKPFDDERFEVAFNRARRRIELEGIERVRRDLLELLQNGHPPAQSPVHATEPRHFERISVQTKGRIRLIPVTSIEYVTANGPYAVLHVGPDQHIIRESLRTLSARLDPTRFMRIHRSVIVRLDLVEALVRGRGGDYEAHLKGGVRLRVSRSRREALQRRLGRVSG